MAEPLFHRGPGRIFRRLGPRAQVVLCQLPLTVVVAVIALITPSAWPSLLGSPWYGAGVALHGLLFLACFLVPWERLPHRPYLLVPVLDFLAIGLMRNGAAPLLPGLAVLAVFPVIWLSASGMLARTSLVLSFLGPFFIMAPTAIGHLPAVTASDLTTVVLFPVMMLAVSLAIRFASVNLRLQQRELAEKDRELRDLLAASREREKLLETVLDATDVGIAAVDRSGHFLVSNSRQRNFRRATGADDAIPGQGHQLIFGQDRRTLLPPDRRPISRAMAGESFADYLVWAGEGPDQRAVSTAARPLVSEDGRLTGAVVVYTDVTGWVESLAANQDLISNVSHEFKNPLNSIIGNVDLVLEEADSLPPHLAQRLLVVQRNAERLLELVADLTATTALNVHPKRTDLASLVETSLSSALASAQRSHVEIAADVPSPLWAYADPLRIGQVLDNLVSNAIKYSPDGGRISISATTDPEWVRLSVSDTGMGISDDDAAKVFNRFFRTESAQKAAIPGAGLGLSITRMIVERHGGSIMCESGEGQGSTFTVTLPAEGPPPSF
ncbi:sensor histidine kinase [Pseudarthrobacter niigatensis]|uniref:histidine kinase n=1 Tax=Pseudarthrobacter niigatensis TaxID=369935 RepID=A0AAJ1WHL3_9MICC|nr:PAS domain-containing sensor histidine kinase [Pseudarthrobacter niigatensis]MDQ0147915.1 signal transduction histidine kinase [Pseudarthrobacter niigatensis]MDQ0268003.1 signal transduction histidine kinase [Pseudarthrobacter niigatensis]